MKKCIFDGCNRIADAKSLCTGHYGQVRRGDSLHELRKRRPKGVSEESWFWAQADKSGKCWVWTLGINEKGYGTMRYRGKMRRVHRIAYELTIGLIPDGLEVDHKCRNRACVNPEHLQVVTRKVNMENRGPTSGSASGIRGVSWYSRKGAWKVKVGHNGHHYFGGYYTSLAKAEKVAIELRNELFTNNLSDHKAA